MYGCPLSLLSLFVFESYIHKLFTNISLFDSFLFYKIEMIQESNLSKFKAEVQSSQVFINYAKMLFEEFEV